MTKLTELCDIQYGYAFDSKEFTDDNSYPQLVRIRDVKRGYSETFYCGNYPKEYVLSSGDLLIGMDGEFNIARWKVDGALLNQRVCKIVAKRNTDEEYLRFALSKALKEIEDRTSFVTVKHLSAKELNKLLIPVPLYDEQRKISETLCRLENIISCRQSELDVLDSLIKARFVELFGDPMLNPKEFPVKTIEQVAVLNKGITYSPEDVANDGMIVLRSSNIKGNVFDLEDLVKITKEISPEKYVQENDILMCNRNGSARLVGKVAMIPRLEENMTFGTFMTIVRSDIYEYLFVFFQMDAFREQIKFQTAVAINQISLPLLASVKVPVPPRELIDEFAGFTRQINKSKFVFYINK